MNHTININFYIYVCIEVKEYCVAKFSTANVKNYLLENAIDLAIEATDRHQLHNEIA